MLADLLYEAAFWVRYNPLPVAAAGVFGAVLAAFGIVAPRVIRRRTDA